MYYTTPHSVTGKTPTELMYGHTIRSKLPAVEDVETAPVNAEYRDRDQLIKEKGKETEDTRRRARLSSIGCGDTVLLQNLLPSNKLSTTYNPKEFRVVSRSGPRVTIEDPENGKSYDRNIAHLKKVSDSVQPSSQVLETSHDSSEEEFYGFELDDGHETPDSSQRGRQRRSTKRPARFDDYQM